MRAVAAESAAAGAVPPSDAADASGGTEHESTVADRGTRGQQRPSHHADDAFLGRLLVDLPLACDFRAEADVRVCAQLADPVVLYLPKAFDAFAHLFK